MPVYFREPSVNLGVGEARGQPPHLTGEDFLKRFGIPEKSAAAYALTDRISPRWPNPTAASAGLDRLATVVKRVRAERGDDKVLLLDGGDTWQGSLGANRSKGQDMVDCMALAEARRDDRPLGIHLRRSAGEGADQGTRLSVPRAQYARHRMERAGVPAVEDVREGRREDRRARPGVSLHAGRQSALDDAEMVVRHPRGGGARQGREGAQGGRAAGGAAVAQRLRCRPQACRARAGHRRDPDRPHA